MSETTTLSSTSPAPSIISESTHSTKSGTAHSKLTSTGRKGFGNIKRYSIEGEELSEINTGDSSTVSTTKNDEVIAPKGLELDVEAASGAKNSGRGGSGNIGGARKALRSGQTSVATMKDQERAVLAANRVKKQLQAKTIRAHGRGGAGNLKVVQKPKEKWRPRGAVGRNTTLRNSHVANLLPRLSMSSSKRHSIASTADTKLTAKASVDGFESRETFQILSDSSDSLAVSRNSPSSSLIPLSPSTPSLAPRRRVVRKPSIQSEDSGNILATSWDELIPHNSDAAITRPTSPIASNQRTKMPAGGGAQWRLVNHIREERRGRHQVFIEEQGWEYVTPEERKLERASVNSKFPKYKAIKAKNGIDQANTNKLDDPFIDL